jgi:poly-gamma-glutamate synthesis protein (capsule biosynthesis protein)
VTSRTRTAPLRLLLTGDLILDEPQPDSFFDGIRPLLQSGDVVIGHVEVPHTTRARPGNFDIPAPPADPRHLAALGRAGFHVATLAGNHIYDSGDEGVEDTIAALHAQHIATTGAGLTIRQARTPAIVTREETRIGVLSYNCVGPVPSWASASKAGCAYLRLVDAEGETAHPAIIPDDRAAIDPETQAAMCDDIAALAAQADVVIVALHKGVGHTPALVAKYERDLARAAIDAGAHIIVGHHAHILRGVEIYKGRPIFHGLGNFVTVTRALTLEDNPSPARKAWAERRRVLFGFEPDPAYPTYPFHPEAKNAMLAVCDIDASGIRPGFVPCWIEPSGRIEPHGRSPKGEAIAGYVERITRAAKLDASFVWDGDRVVFR